MNDTIRVLIASDVRLYRDGLVNALQAVSGFAVASAVSALDGVAAARHLRPDLILLDLAAPRRIALLRELAALDGPAVVVLALEDSSDEVLACVEAGARGYLTRDGTLDDLVATLRSVARGEMPCSPDVAALLVRRLADLSALRVASAYTPLTHRELEIVALLDRDLTNKSIAATLGIELATVKNHIHNILSKLHVRRRTDVTASLGAAGRFGQAPGRAVHPRPGR
jgi:DNA-binding NarL/FixJ family response regulator